MYSFYAPENRGVSSTTHQHAFNHASTLRQALRFHARGEGFEGTRGAWEGYHKIIQVLFTVFDLFKGYDRHLTGLPAITWLISLTNAKHALHPYLCKRKIPESVSLFPPLDFSIPACKAAAAAAATDIILLLDSPVKRLPRPAGPDAVKKEEGKRTWCSQTAWSGISKTKSTGAWSPKKGKMVISLHERQWGQVTFPAHLQKHRMFIEAEDWAFFLGSMHIQAAAASLYAG